MKAQASIKAALVAVVADALAFFRIQARIYFDIVPMLILAVAFIASIAGMLWGASAANGPDREKALRGLVISFGAFLLTLWLFGHMG